jgi:hypothetical protein
VTKTHQAEVPESVVFDDERDACVTVTFEFRAGTPPSGLSGPPENYDPGSGDEFYVVNPAGLWVGAEDRIIEWLDANWERPDDQPDWDAIRDQRRDDELTGQ